MLALLEHALADGTVAAAIVVIVVAEYVFLVATRRRRLAAAVLPGLGLAVGMLIAQEHGDAPLIGMALLGALLAHIATLREGWRE